MTNTTEPKKPFDVVNGIIAYEAGEMREEEDVIEFFQELINSGLCWQLQGHYGRTAAELIKNGHCVNTPAIQRDRADAIEILKRYEKRLIKSVYHRIPVLSALRTLCPGFEYPEWDKVPVAEFLKKYGDKPNG